MAQSPLIISGLSSNGIASVYVGGVYRDHLQVHIALTTGSSDPAGVLNVNVSDVPGYTGNNTFYSLSGMSVGVEYFSTVQSGFFKYINVFTTSISSAYFGAM